MSIKSVFKSELIERGDDFVKFRFYSVNGNNNKDLMKKVFEMYVDKPLLRPVQTGRGFLFGDANTLTSQNFNYSVEDDGDSLIIQFYSTLLRNREVDASEVNETESFIYLGNKIFKISGVGYTGIMAAFALETLIKCLDGMVQEISEDMYVPNCKNCVYRLDSMVEYLKILIKDGSDYYEECLQEAVNGCTFSNAEECMYYEHEDEASFQRIEKTFEDIFYIEE